MLFYILAVNIKSRWSGGVGSRGNKFFITSSRFPFELELYSQSAELFILLLFGFFLLIMLSCLNDSTLSL